MKLKVKLFKVKSVVKKHYQCQKSHVTNTSLLTEF